VMAGRAGLAAVAGDGPADGVGPDGWTPAMVPGGGLGGSVKNVGGVVVGTRWGARDAGSTISRIGLPVADGNETPSSLAMVGAISVCR
jgi:hypothetical protein